MKSLFDFIVEPVGHRYNNKVKVGDKSLIINTQVETFKAVNNVAKVIEVPLSYKTVIQKGDEILPWKKFNSNMAISVEYDLEY